MSANPRAPELPADFAWLNTDRPLTFAQEQRGQVRTQLSASLA